MQENGEAERNVEKGGGFIEWLWNRVGWGYNLGSEKPKSSHGRVRILNFNSANADVRVLANSYRPGKQGIFFLEDISSTLMSLFMSSSQQG